MSRPPPRAAEELFSGSGTSPGMPCCSTRACGAFEGRMTSCPIARRRFGRHSGANGDEHPPNVDASQCGVALHRVAPRIPHRIRSVGDCLVCSMTPLRASPSSAVCAPMSPRSRARSGARWMRRLIHAYLGDVASIMRSCYIVSLFSFRLRFPPSSAFLGMAFDACRGGARIATDHGLSRSMAGAHGSQRKRGKERRGSAAVVVLSVPF